MASSPSVCGREPALRVAVHDRVHGEHQRGGHRDRARDVEPPRRGCAAPGRQQPQREDDDGDADRDVDEEDPVPVERVGEDAAEEHADRAAAGGDEAEDPHRLRALARLGEEHHRERERDGRGDRAADALHGARRLEHACVCASPQASEATVKSAIPPMKSRRWP